MDSKKSSFQSWRGNKHTRSSSNRRGELQSVPSRVEQKVPISWSMFKREAFLGQGAYGDVHKVKCLQTTCLSQDGTCRILISDEEAAKIIDQEQQKNMNSDGTRSPFLNKSKILLRGEQYVIKTINVANLDQKAQFEALNEIETLQIMRSQNIVGYLDSFVSGDDAEPLINIVIEYCQAGDLHSYIIQYLEKNEKMNKGGQYLAEETVWKVFIDLCLGLEHMHRMNHIHRDLKPLNIFITDKQVAKLGDLGCALRLSIQDELQALSSPAEVSMNDSMVMQNLMHTMQKTHNQFGRESVDEGENPIGTPYYVSPEIWTKRQYSRASDIWALGVILYEMLSLKKPFPANDQAELVDKVCNQPYLRIRFGVSKIFKQMVDSMLQKDPKKRPTISDIIVNPDFQNMAKKFGVILPSKLTNLTGQSSSEEATRSTAPALRGKSAQQAPTYEIKQPDQPRMNLQDIEDDQFLFKCEQGDPLNTGAGSLGDVEQIPHEEMADQRFFTKEEDENDALKQALVGKMGTGGPEESRNEKNLERRESLLFQYLSNSMYDSVDQSMMRRTSQNLMIGEQSFLHEHSLNMDTSQVNITDLIQEANQKKEKEKESNQKAGALPKPKQDGVTLYLDPLLNPAPLDQNQKVDIHGTFSVARPWLDKIPCTWDDSRQCFKASLKIKDGDKFRFIINDGQRFECSKLYETFTSSVGTVNNVYSSKAIVQPPTPEPKALEDIEVQLDRQSRSADPSESTQYQIVEIMKNGKMVQLKVPKQDELGAGQNESINQMQINPSIQGMTNLQRKKLANKTKMREMDKKQNQYLEKLYQYSEKLLELQEKQKQKTDTEDDRKLMEKLEMKSKNVICDMKSLKHLPMKAQLQQMNLSSFNTIIEEPESNRSSPKATPAGFQFELNENATDEIARATQGKDKDSFEELNYFTARDDPQPLDKDEPKEPSGLEKQHISFDKGTMQSKMCTLENLIDMLEQVYQTFPATGFEDLITALGMTGCGKSTMFTALVYGPESLQLKTIEDTVSIRMRDGSMKDKKVKQQVIDQKDDLNQFTIGHSKSESMTFLPHFVTDEEAGVVYADIAGLNDTNGEFVEFLNCFINRKIFLLSSNVRFILPFTETQIKENKGQQARSLVQIIQQICSQNSLSQVISSVQPVLTKCKPGMMGLDIDEIRSVFAEQLMNDVEKYSQENQEQTPDELVQDSQEFYNQFAFSLEIFDPLDRCIPSADDDQAQKCYNMKDILVQLPSLAGSTLNVPMSANLRQVLAQLFSAEQQKCNRAAEACISEAKELGTGAGRDLSQKFQQDKSIQTSHRILSFFVKHQLIEDAQERLSKFKQFIKSTLNMIESAKTYAQMSKEGQQLYNYIQHMFIARNQLNFVGLVKAMINLQGVIDNFKINNLSEGNQDPLVVEKQSELQRQMHNAQRAIEDTIIDLSGNFSELVQFAYELRKQDAEDRYTYSFINGQVKPPILVDIICSNQWNNVTQKMEVDMSMACFRLMVGRASCLQYQLRDGKRGDLDDEGALVVTKATAMHKDHVDAVAFVLENHGVLIESLDGRQLAATDIISSDLNLEQANNKNLKWLNKAQDYSSHQDSFIEQEKMSCRLWTLRTLDRDSWDPHFYIELTTGEKKQRLISRQANPALSCKCLATLRAIDGYDVSEQSIWKIYLKPIQKFHKRR